MQLRRLRVITGEKSGDADVTSGVSQGSVLGPLLFFIYVNDIVDNVKFYLRMFAEDCVTYRVIHNVNDGAALQGDIDRTPQRCSIWHMNLRVKKKDSAHLFI